MTTTRRACVPWLCGARLLLLLLLSAHVATARDALRSATGGRGAVVAPPGPSAAMALAARVLGEQFARNLSIVISSLGSPPGRDSSRPQRDDHHSAEDNNNNKNDDSSHKNETRDRTDEEFAYYAADGWLFINATSVPTACAALHHYMRLFMNSSVTWGVNRTGYYIEPLVTQFPSTDSSGSGGGQTFVSERATVGQSLERGHVRVIRRQNLGRYRYHMNVCTLGFSTAFWSLDDWHRHIDWMALHGINLPLASTGTEFVWWRTYTEYFNLTSQEVRSYFTGVAFLPWNRMGNIHTWAGPMSESFLKSQATLQRGILRRMRQLGLSPVLPAFDGHVPTALVERFPSSRFTKASDWLGDGSVYSENYLLDPTEPLFSLIAQRFLQIQREEFGISDFYNADMWNEMNPPANASGAYLRRSAEAVYNPIASVNPNATWIVQGWTFFQQQEFWTRGSKAI